MATTETRKMVLAAAAVCEEKKAENTRVLELDPADSGFTDFFLITSGTNTRQTVAIADDIELKMKREFGTYANSVEGRRAGEWILMDYVDFVVHIFVEEKRAFYDIERLRKSARSIDVTQLKAALSEKTAASRRVHPRPTVADQTQAEAVLERDTEQDTERTAAAPARKSVGKKTTLGKRVSAAKKSAARKSADAGKKSPAKKTAPARKSATRIAAAAGAQATSGKSAAAKKGGAESTGTKKTGTKKTAAQKTAARRAAKKTTVKKKSRSGAGPRSGSESRAGAEE